MVLSTFNCCCKTRTISASFLFALGYYNPHTVMFRSTLYVFIPHRLNTFYAVICHKFSVHFVFMVNTLVYFNHVWPFLCIGPVIRSLILFRQFPSPAQSDNYTRTRVNWVPNCKFSSIFMCARDPPKYRCTHFCLPETRILRHRTCHASILMWKK